MEDKCSVHGSESCPGASFYKSAGNVPVCGENHHGEFRPLSGFRINSAYCLPRNITIADIALAVALMKPR